MKSSHITFKAPRIKFAREFLWGNVDYIKHLSDAHVLETQRTMLLMRWGCAVGTLAIPIGLFWIIQRMDLGLPMALGISGAILAVFIIACVKFTKNLKLLEAEVEKRRL